AAPASTAPSCAGRSRCCSTTRRQTMPSSTLPLPKQRTQVLGRTMAYAEVGRGDPIVLLHGNPTSSYLWRNVIPHLRGLGRCIAPDLIGMGDSDKLPGSGPGSYPCLEPRAHPAAPPAQPAAPEGVVFGGHDGGGALSFDGATRPRAGVKGIAYRGAMVRPSRWWDSPPQARPIFEALR